MLPSVDDCAPPTTSPRLLTLSATFIVPPRLPRSVAEPSFSHSTACAPLGLGEIVVFEHNPDEPTTWPMSLIAKANPTVSPVSGGSLWISPLGPRSEERRVGKEWSSGWAAARLAPE